MPYVIAIILGILAGGVVNALADDLPRRKNPRLPHYPDGTPRPLTAWLGLTAFLFGQRESPNAKPTPFKKRYFDTWRSVKKVRRRGTGIRWYKHWFWNYRKSRRMALRSTKLTWRYPLTELMTALFMVLAFVAKSQRPEVSDLQFIFWLVYMAIFALIIVIDMEHKLILFVVIIPSVAITLLDAIIAQPPPSGDAPFLVDALIGGVGGFVVFFLLYNGGFLFTYVMGKLRGKKINEVAFGYGDVMLAGVSGLMIGWRALLFSMVVTIFLGAFGAIIYLVSRRLVGKRYSAFTAIPYGPYIVIGTMSMLLFPSQVGNWLMPG